MQINIDSVKAIAKAAGEEILQIYQEKKPESLLIKTKADASPITEADIKAHHIITAGLKQLTPTIPILSEEDAKIPFDERQHWHYYWLVDPLDGTKEFINRTHEFTVNIALIKNGFSILGVIYVPYYDVMYYAENNKGTFKEEKGRIQQIHARKMPGDHCIVAVSRRHSVEKAQGFLKRLPNHETLARGSSLKTCIIAEGLADIYPSFGPTSEWDMGAAQCIIHGAGGAMLDLNLEPLRFNQKSSLINPPLLIVGDANYNWKKYL